MNKIIIYITIIFEMVIILVPTVSKVIKISRDNQYVVMKKLVEEASLKCIYEGKCKKNIITLKELYDNNYISDKIIDPVSKVYYSDDSYVIIKKEGTEFNLS